MKTITEHFSNTIISSIIVVYTMDKGTGVKV